MGRIGENIQSVSERIAAAAARAGRSPDEVRLMVVTKTQPRAAVEEAYTAGMRLFGENRIAEAQEKYAGFHADAELHMIGHLQRNKVNRAVGLVSCVQSVDKVETAAALQRRCVATGGTLELFLEVNTSGEGSKEGFLSDVDLFAALEVIIPMSSLKLRGLMTIATLTDDHAEVRRCFRALAALRDEAHRRFGGEVAPELSMGMTGDFEIAVEEGSTLVRVGSAVFGPRAIR